MTAPPDVNRHQEVGAVIAIEQLAVGADAAAALIGVSARTWRRWHSAGLVPAPVRVGRSVRWRVDEIVRWLRAGCPARGRWRDRGPSGAREPAPRCEQEGEP